MVKITCVDFRSFISSSALAWFLLRDKNVNQFLQWQNNMVSFDCHWRCFWLIFHGSVTQIHKEAASPHLDTVFQQQFFILDSTNVIFTAVCWLLLWYDYLYQFRGLKILSQIWLQIVLWKQKAAALPGAFTNIYVTNLLSSVGVFRNWKRKTSQVNIPTFQLPAAKFCSAPAAPSSVSGFEHSERSVR